VKGSDYWRRQCKATLQYDPIGTKLIDEIEAESLVQPVPLHQQQEQQPYGARST
jgi:hypothetical protein